ncbi:PH domain-containing protein [Nesterenkonia sp. E16_7]|uniref:PH domain-containing protein n=1 Tax=unclassified Nesterenkonia TaxID=2629769 RepID=UPI001A931DA3|nr:MULTISPECIES: PH domain-containing protein [unclassified Nesterenkonia]MBO0595440.1 PH domain-containing protein [Nesterenkonia sp. E16_10]MBO0599112.1 PH domain-containing protein [Nesterenkonia sp. E16_7]
MEDHAAGNQPGTQAGNQAAEGRATGAHAPDQAAGEPKGTSERWFDASWTKVHPLSPIVRGGLAVIAIPGIFLSYNWQSWMDAWEAFRSGEIQRNLESNPTPFLFGAGGVLLVIAVIFSSFVLSWWFTRYKITSEHVMVKSGIFVRQHRQARIDRVQAVDLRQPLLARLTGLAELKFEVAEGDGTAATLAFLKKSQAEELRSEIMDRASGRDAPLTAAEGLGATHGDAGPGPAGPGEAYAGHTDPGHAYAGHTDPGQAYAGYAYAGQADPARSHDSSSAQHPHAGGPTPESHHIARQDRLIAKVPTGRLIGSVLSGWGTVFVLVILITAMVSIGIGLAVGSDADSVSIWAVLTGVGLPAVIPMGIAAVTIYYQQFSSGFGFTSTATSSGLRVRYGLLETTNQTIPPGRVQALQIQQPVLWRPFKWFRIVVTVAGYGIGEKRSVLLPVGRLEDVMATAAEMFPDLQVENPEEVFTAGLTGTGTELGYTEVPRRARFFDPIVRRRRGFRTTPTALMFRDGRASRQLTMVPHERIQSLSLTQGPLQRRRSIADIFIHSPAGPFAAKLKNQDLDAVKDLFEYESDHAAQARRYSDRNQWMRPEELREFERKAAEALAAPEAAAAGEFPVRAAPTGLPHPHAAVHPADLPTHQEQDPRDR